MEKLPLFCSLVWPDFLEEELQKATELPHLHEEESSGWGGGAGVFKEEFLQKKKSGSPLLRPYTNAFYGYHQVAHHIVSSSCT